MPSATVERARRGETCVGTTTSGRDPRFPCGALAWRQLLSRGCSPRCAGDRRSPLGKRSLDAGELIGRQSPTDRAGVFMDLIGALGAAERDGDARLMERPIDRKLGKRDAGFGGDRPQAFEQVLILLPL